MQFQQQRSHAQHQQLQLQPSPHQLPPQQQQQQQQQQLHSHQPSSHGASDLSALPPGPVATASVLTKLDPTSLSQLDPASLQLLLDRTAAEAAKLQMQIFEQTQREQQQVQMQQQEAQIQQQQQQQQQQLQLQMQQQQQQEQQRQQQRAHEQQLEHLQLQQQQLHQQQEQERVQQEQSQFEFDQNQRLQQQIHSAVHPSHMEHANASNMSGSEGASMQLGQSDETRHYLPQPFAPPAALRPSEQDPVSLRDHSMAHSHSLQRFDSDYTNPLFASEEPPPLEPSHMQQQQQQQQPHLRHNQPAHLDHSTLHHHHPHPSETAAEDELDAEWQREQRRQQQSYLGSDMLGGLMSPPFSPIPTAAGAGPNDPMMPACLLPERAASATHIPDAVDEMMTFGDSQTP